MGFCDFRARRVGDLLPWITDADGLVEENVRTVAGNAQPEADDDDLFSEHGGPGPAPAAHDDPFAQFFSEFIFPLSIKVPGLLHICHNAMKDACDALIHFEKFKVMLIAVCRFFEKKQNRENFTENVLKDTPYENDKGLFESGPAEFAEWRWGTLMTTCL